MRIVGTFGRLLWPVLLGSCLFAAALQAGQPTVVVGTGPVSGAYYPAGGALCRLVNEAQDGGGPRCLVESTAGSAENLQGLRDGRLDFALLQSDWQYYAGRDGTAAKEESNGVEPVAGLRAVLSLQAQPFTLLAGPDSGIAVLRDLEDKIVNLGPADSAPRKAAMALLEALGWDEDDFAALTELGPLEQVDALCGAEVDAILMAVSHPSGVVSAATDRCGARLIPIEGPAVEVLLAAWPFYAPAVIPAGLYRGNAAPVASFGLRATLATRAETPEALVYGVVSLWFERLEDLRRQHPALAALEAREMVSQANTLDLHEGAMRFYREKGWK